MFPARLPGPAAPSFSSLVIPNRAKGPVGNPLLTVLPPTPSSCGGNDHDREGHDVQSCRIAPEKNPDFSP